MRSIDITDNTLDSRDIDAKIEALQAERADLATAVDDACALADTDAGAGDVTGHEREAKDERASAATDARAALAEWDDSDDAGLLAGLLTLREELSGYCPDWRAGASLIADAYFDDYARELAEDIGAIKADAGWPYDFIDWPAAFDALKQDYTSCDVTVDGATYTFWAR